MLGIVCMHMVVIAHFKDNGSVWGSDELWCWLGYVLNCHCWYSGFVGALLLQGFN